MGYFRRKEAEAFGEAIRRGRAAKGLNQRDFSRLLGVAQATVSNWELGKAVPDGINLLLISRVLGIDPAEFLSWLEKGGTEGPGHPRRPKAIAGGSGQAQPPPAPNSEDKLSLIRHRLRQWWGLILPCPWRPAFVC